MSEYAHHSAQMETTNRLWTISKVNQLAKEKFNDFYIANGTLVYKPSCYF